MAGTTTTTIQISRETRNELRKQGFKGETYDEILHKLIELAKHETFLERQKHILENEEFVPLEKV